MYIDCNYDLLWNFGSDKIEVEIWSPGKIKLNPGTVYEICFTGWVVCKPRRYCNLWCFCNPSLKKKKKERKKEKKGVIWIEQLWIAVEGFRDLTSAWGYKHKSSGFLS